MRCAKHTERQICFVVKIEQYVNCCVVTKAFVVPLPSIFSHLTALGELKIPKKIAGEKIVEIPNE
jgi:hypothetical protein